MVKCGNEKKYEKKGNPCLSVTTVRRMTLAGMVESDGFQQYNEEEYSLLHRR